MDNQWFNKKRNRLQTYNKYYYLKKKDEIQNKKLAIIEFQKYYWYMYEHFEPQKPILKEIIVKFD